ncbi:MAG: PorT family protein [Muribaculaceae bacterium]|nr:PorT family protein [Muribaculaceae bacterium]
MTKLIKRVVILIIVIFFSLEGESQLRYGFRFGGDFASASLKNADGYSLVNRSGFTGGLDLEYQFEKCGFAPDIAILYARHNTRLRSGEEEPHSFGRNFIDIPLRLKYKFWLKSTKDLFGPLVYTGPVFSFRLDHNDANPLRSKRFQPGWEVGLGFDIINFIQLSGGYRFGLGNAVADFEGFPTAVLHTNGWNLSATILFDF